MSNKKQIKDYLHYYIGKNMSVQIISEDGYTWSKPTVVKITHYALNEIEKGNYSNPNPHLRPLSSMTEDDIRLWAKRCLELGYKYVEKATEKDFAYAANQVRNNELNGFDFESAPELVPESISFLLKQGFDLFGLIDAGLAIDKTKIN